jgi:hypothetical protein
MKVCLDPYDVDTNEFVQINVIFFDIFSEFQVQIQSCAKITHVFSNTTHFKNMRSFLLHIL